MKEECFALDLVKAPKLAAADFEHEPVKGAYEEIAVGIEIEDVCSKVAAASPPKTFAAGAWVAERNDDLLRHGPEEAVSETEDSDLESGWVEGDAG